MEADWISDQYVYLRGRLFLQRQSIETRLEEEGTFGAECKKEKKKKIGKDYNCRTSFLSEDASVGSFRLPGAASTDDSLVHRAKIWRRPPSSLTLLRRKTVALSAGISRISNLGGCTLTRKPTQASAAGVVEKRNKKKKRQKRLSASSARIVPTARHFFKVRHPLSYAAIEARRSFAVATSHKTTSKTTAKRPHACAGSASCESNVAVAATAAAAYDCSINKSTQQRCCR